MSSERLPRDGRELEGKICAHVCVRATHFHILYVLYVHTSPHVHITICSYKMYAVNGCLSTQYPSSRPMGDCTSDVIGFKCSLVMYKSPLPMATNPTKAKTWTRVCYLIRMKSQLQWCAFHTVQHSSKYVLLSMSSGSAAQTRTYTHTYVRTYVQRTQGQSAQALTHSQD